LRPIQLLLRVGGADDARWSVLSAYDQHTYQWSVKYPILKPNLNYADPSLGVFLPWKLLLSRPLVLPASGATVPAEEVEIGLLRRGSTDPASSDYNDLSDWQVHGDTVEVRIPWMMIGFMDPSSRSVWDWPYAAGGFRPVPTAGLQIEPKVVTDHQELANDGPPALYQWSPWDVPVYRERLKPGYLRIQNAMGGYAALQPLDPVPRDPSIDTVPAAPPAVRAVNPGDARSAEWRKAHPR
jgi:hypothetical protein